MPQEKSLGDRSRQEPSAKMPVIALPKGGGTLGGMGEKFGANPVTGTASMTVPIATTPGRLGFGPQLSLSYDSGSGNGPFGFGWSLALPSIARKTEKGLPRYLDESDSDTFILSGSEDLVPAYRQDAGGSWVASHPGYHGDSDGLCVRDPSGRLVIHEDEIDGYRVRLYRPRIEGLFARVERWSRLGAPDDVHWRSISKDNLLTLYGLDNRSRITDPRDGRRIFSWMICETRDDRGNAVIYEYKSENGNGAPFQQSNERNRGAGNDFKRSVNRYLKRIHYGNRATLLDSSGNRPRFVDQSQFDSASWMFEAVFDYGEHDTDTPVPADLGPWKYRSDPFSSYRPGFEVRTTRLCRRVLMFHHFPGEPGVGRDCLVRSTDFTYSNEIDPTDVRNPVYTFLQGVTQTSYRRNNGDYQRRNLPPVEFEYTKPSVQDKVEEVDSGSLENLATGLHGAYRWADLHGEGIPGVLTEEAGAWFYKRNLSAIPQRLASGLGFVKATLAPLEIVAFKPNLAIGDTKAEFMDLAGDGQVDVVVLGGPVPGLYEHDKEESWERFRPFTSRLNRDLRDPNARLIDLTGDGRADLLVTEDSAFAWHKSLSEEGFGPEMRVSHPLDEEMGPRVVFADPTQSIHLADLSGDGLTDIVRIRNGEVCYWPNLGYGHFGAKVTMDHAPWFDHPDQFDPNRLRLADIDGSGTSDIIYLHGDGIRLYFNQSGNAWSQPQILKAFPRVDNFANIVPADLLGNGTACLVWSSPLPAEGHRPMRYVRLMGDQKPHLLVKTTNNLGAETRVEYAPSTKFYLQDKRDGRPWITRLPFPVHVVERVHTYDHVSRNRFVTRYAYHHGCFDRDEREFRGFGMVEQWDSEAMAALSADGSYPVGENVTPQSNVPPVLTRTWFHTGIYVGGERISNYFAGLPGLGNPGEYFREPELDDELAAALLLPDTTLPSGLSTEEEREACRALKGMMLRQEVYADDAMPGAGEDQLHRSRTPYTVTEQNFTIRTVQSRGTNRHAVFLTHGCEAISYHYERNHADPRIQHQLTLEVDSWGNALKEAAIGYGRRKKIRVADAMGNVQQIDNPGLNGLHSDDQAKQTTPLITYTENRVTNSIEFTDTHRSPSACQTLTFELTNYTPTGAAGRYQASDFVEPDPGAAGRLRHRFVDEVAYESAATANACRRPIKWLRVLYRSDDVGRLLQLGTMDSRALPGESYQLAFTPGLLTQAFQRPRVGQPDEPLLSDPAAVLEGRSGDEGGYVSSQTLKSDGRFPATDADDHWWIPSGRSFFSSNPADSPAAELAQAQQHFFLPRRYRDPFNQDSVAAFDANDLLMIESRDALGNRVTVDANDYRVLQPRLVSDPNRNQTQVAFDTLGMVAGTVIMGKPAPAPAEGDTLSGFEPDLTEAQLDAFFDSADPHATAPALLGSATTRIVYDADRFRRSREAHPDDPTQWQPAWAATIARETHLASPVPPQGLRVQLSFGYSDGFGREIQKKIQAEPGPLVDAGPVVAPRWIGSGWVIFNNKGKPVRRYEPYFSKRRRADGSFFSDHRFEFGVAVGVSAVLFYDPAGRAIAKLHPNHTYEKTLFDPWRQTTYDVNDTSAARNQQTGDPRSDPDIRGYVAEYFKTQPASWQTWQAQRIGGGLGTLESDAAKKASEHADTPSTVHFDAFGRPFMTVVRNRVACVGHDLDGTQEEIATRVELDIEGNQRSVRDQRKLPDNALPVGPIEERAVMRYAYDMLGNRIHQASMEAGARWVLSDIAGKPIHAWDSRGHHFSSRYDSLRRPIEQYVRGTFSDPDPLKPNSDPRALNPPDPNGLLIDRMEYGEPPLNASAAEETEAQRLNLRTRIYRHFDSAGVATSAQLDAGGKPIEAYDFKGNLLRSTRQLVSDYKGIPDWSRNPTLDAETFEAATRYDALNRPVQSVAPHSSVTRAGHPNKFNVIQPVFNEANLLDRVDVWLERAAEPGGVLDPATEAPSTVGVAHIGYDAKGQRTLIEYKTGPAADIRTDYEYDRDTFRLKRLHTLRSGDAAQDLNYTYDSAGNITHIHDGAQQTLYFNNQAIEPDNDYVYDALYRLIQADGREHLGQLAGGNRMPPTAPDALNSFHMRKAQPNVVNAMGTFTERYVYDAAGNFLKMQHRGSDPANPGWTRAYTYAQASQLEPSKNSNRLTSTMLNPAGTAPQLELYTHDAHGNMQMPHLTRADWDYRDQLVATSRQAVNDFPPPATLPQTTYYVYDNGGQRVRKVCEKSPGLIEERIYLGGFEIFRRHDGAITPDSVTLERETLHITDDKQRIALVEIRTLGSEPSVPRLLVRYQVANHLGSASLELDEQARIISYEEYSPFGSTTYQAARNQLETAKRYRYTGKERDEESGLYYHGARYYAPWLGRWIACDPAGINSSLNLFAYVRLDPVSLFDPDGKEDQAKGPDKLSNEEILKIYKESGGISDFKFRLGFGPVTDEVLAKYLSERHLISSGKDKPQPQPQYDGPSIGPSNEPYGRRHRFVRVPVDDPLQYELKEVWATADEAVEIQTQINSKEASDRAAAALAAAAAGGRGSASREALSKVQTGPAIQVGTTGRTPTVSAPNQVAPATNGLKAPTVSSFGGILNADWGEGNQGARARFKVWSENNRAIVEVYELYRGNQPKGSGGEMLTLALKGANVAKPNLFVLHDIVNEPTVQALKTGTDFAETVVGKAFAKTISQFGGHIEGIEIHSVRNKGEKRIQYDVTLRVGY